MPTSLFRVVLDTNILVRGLLNEKSPSARVLRAAESRIVLPLISFPVLTEYRTILADPELVERYPQLEEERVKTVLERLWYVGDVLRHVRARFHLPRDPKDSKLIELAIAGDASHLITTDRDLLDLRDSNSAVARNFRRRLPQTEVIKPNDFLEKFGNRLLRPAQN